MEIVIEIDENLYTRLFDNGVDNYDDAVDMAKAIRKGTPLPKGHGDLIDRSEISIPYDICDGDEAMGYVNEVSAIVEADKCCTYKETGCGSCKRQLDCPIEADKEKANE